MMEENDVTIIDQGHDQDTWINVGEENQNSAHENFTEVAMVVENEEEQYGAQYINDDGYLEDTEDSDDDFAPVQLVSLFLCLPGETLRENGKPKNSRKKMF